MPKLLPQQIPIDGQTLFALPRVPSSEAFGRRLTLPCRPLATRRHPKPFTTAVFLRVANNEGHRIIRRTLVSRTYAISSRASGLALMALCGAWPARNRRSTPAAVNRCQAQSADSLSSDACSRYRIGAEVAQSGRGSDPGRGLATADVRCN